MATYTELNGLFNDANLRIKVRVAVIIAAENLRTKVSPTAAEKAWAAKAFAAPHAEVNRVLMSVLAGNKDATVAQITSATDATVQAAVDSVIPTFVDSDAGV